MGLDALRFATFLKARSAPTDLRLQIKLLSAGSAVCTYFMKRFAVAHRFLQRQSKNARTDFGKLVPLLISLPIFQACNFFFKLAYSIQQRRLRITLFDIYFVNGNFYDKTLVDLGRKRSGKPRETPEEYIRRTEECD